MDRPAWQSVTVLAAVLAAGATAALPALAGASTGQFPVRHQAVRAAPAPAATVQGSWRLLPRAPLTKGAYPGLTVAVWTGQQMIIHGIQYAGNGASGVTLAYRPSTNRWSRLPNGPRPLTAEGGDAAVWTGSEMLVLGLTSAAYRPASGTWRAIARPSQAPPSEIAGWTGHEAIAWEGVCCGNTVNSAEAYNPATDTWRVIKSPLERRTRAMGAWTGKLLIVAGGLAEAGGVPERVFRDGAAYNPATSTWRRLPPMPERRAGGTAVWDGKEVLFLGGTAPGSRLPALRGMAYNPATNRWRLLPLMQYRRADFVAVPARGRTLVWGGQYRQGGTWLTPPHGEAYSQPANRWDALPVSPLRGRQAPVAVWTGRSMVIWGGFYYSGGNWSLLLDGAAFTPRG